MSSPVLCIGPDTTLEEAAQIMGEQEVSCLPVVTGAFLVGIVTRAALATVGLAAPEAELAPRSPAARAARPTRATRSGAIRARAASRCAPTASAAPRRTSCAAWPTELRIASGGARAPLARARRGGFGTL